MMRKERGRDLWFPEGRRHMFPGTMWEVFGKEEGLE